MKFLTSILTNPFLIATVAAWFFAQLSKVFIHWGIYKKFDIRRFLGDGGMPSAHSATVMALTVFTGCYYGFDSFQLAACAVLTIIVCRDAVGVRMETGKQAKIINDLREYVIEFGKGEIDETKLKEFVGHTPLQVLVGLMLGAVVALIFAWILI